MLNYIYKQRKWVYGCNWLTFVMFRQNLAVQSMKVVSLTYGRTVGYLFFVICTSQHHLWMKHRL